MREKIAEKLKEEYGKDFEVVKIEYGTVFLKTPKKFDAKFFDRVGRILRDIKEVPALFVEAEIFDEYESPRFAYSGMVDVSDNLMSAFRGFRSHSSFWYGYETHLKDINVPFEDVEKVIKETYEKGLTKRGG